MSRMLAVVGLTVLSGCTVSLGRTGLIADDADVVPMKLLRPGVVGRSCRASVLGVPFRAGPPTVAEALAEMLAKDTEGNVVTHAEMTWSEVVTGVYNRRCLEMRGDVARAVPLIRLPHHVPGNR